MSNKQVYTDAAASLFRYTTFLSAAVLPVQELKFAYAHNTPAAIT